MEDSGCLDLLSIIIIVKSLHVLKTVMIWELVRAVNNLSQFLVYACWDWQNWFAWHRWFDRFAPRKLHPDGGYWNAEPHQNGIYNTLFPTKGAFLHKRFYELYWAPKLEWVRKLLQFRFIYLLGDYASVMVKMVAPDLLSDDFPPACLPAADTGPAGQPTPVIPCPRRPSATPAGPQHHRHECHCGGHPHELNPRHRNRAGTF